MKQALNKTVLAIALVSMGFAFGAHAQNAPSSSKVNPPGTSAQQGRTQQSANAGKLSADDRHFAEKAAEGGMAEVSAGKLAEQKAQDPQVKRFAQRMADDHAQANDKLQQIASTKGIDLPTKLDKKAEKDVDKLEKVSPDKFDKTYMKGQVSDHKSVIKEFQKEAKSGKDADLRNFAQSTLPTLQEHLKLAQSAEQEVMGKSASTSGSSRSESNPTMSASTGTPSEQKGLKAAKKATGATSVDAEKQEHMPVPKTGM